MFGFSFAKLLLTAVVVLAVWYGFKLMSKNDEGPAVADKKKKTKANIRSDAEDLVECAVCGAYVAPATAKACGREGCPYAA